MPTTISGASDDLVEVEGDVSEEFSAASSDDGVLGLSNGVLLRIRYDRDGVWRITPITVSNLVQIVQAPVDDEDNYSDVATVEGPVEWIVYGSEYARKGK